MPTAALAATAAVASTALRFSPPPLPGDSDSRFELSMMSMVDLALMIG
jgi:hypothetical protein